MGEGTTQKPGYLQNSSGMNLSENTTKEKQTASHTSPWGIPALYEKLESRFSPRTLMLSLALAPRHAGKLRLPCLLKRSEVQQLHPENVMQQVAQPSSCLATPRARAPSAGKLQPAIIKYICHCLDALKQALANVLGINIEIWLCTTSSGLHM